MQYLTFYEKTILENIDVSDYGYNEQENEHENRYQKVLFVYQIFLNEYSHEIKRLGEVEAFKNWLQGLPTVLTVPFYNSEILQKAEKDGVLNTEKLNREEADKIEDNFLCEYWEKCAKAFFNLKNNL